MKLHLIQKILVSLDIILFMAVLLLIPSNQLSTELGITLLISWIIVFFATIISMTQSIKQGSDEWYHYGIMVTTGILMAIIVGIILSFDVYGIALLIPITVAPSLIINRLFTDNSEEEIEKDLKKLEKEIPQ
jgi:hypothetical protein